MRIALLGDVALFGINTVQHGTYRQRMDAARRVLKNCDYVVANLETPLTTVNRIVGGKSAYLKGSPADVEILEWLGVTHCSLANNHVFDYGEQGLVDTITTLESSSIRWYGANGKSERIKNPDGIVSLHGYCCYSTNAKGLERKVPFVNVLDPYQMERDLVTDDEFGAYPILSCHWGQEHVHYPNYDHVELARKLSKDRQVTIHGHHPHVIQGIEKADDALIAYSLGNFCFDDIYTSKSDRPLVKLSEYNKKTIILVIEVKNGVLIDFEIYPISFVEGQYQRHDSILRELDQYSAFLSKDEREYNEQREHDLSKYIRSRKKQRDAKWYFKRMNMDTIKMVASARRNSKAYCRHIKEYIASA